MALRFYDGFDHYPNTEALNKWSTWSSQVSFVAGRLGGSALSTGSRSITKSMDAQSEWIIGFAFLPPAGSGPFCKLFNAATLQDDLYWDSSTGRLSVRRAGSVTLGTSSKQLNQNIWYYVELRIVLSDTVGVVNLRVDSEDVINLTNLDTINSGTTADRFTFGDPGATNVSAGIDDLYICDGTGAAPYNTFLGDCRVETLMPSGNGNSSQFDGSDGNQTDNYLLVDEAASDDDTTYVESADVGDKDTYAYGDLASTGGTVYAVQILPWARKTDAGSRNMVTVARLSATEVDSSSIALPMTYTYVAQDIRTTKPGGGAWTISDVNSAEFGVKVAA